MEECLESLVDIFPSYPRSELAARLLCAHSYNLLVDELFTEQSSALAAESSKYGPDVMMLKEMFPSITLDTLAAELQKNGSVQETMNLLLEGGWRDDCASLGLPVGSVEPLVEKHNGDFLMALAELIGKAGRRPNWEQLKLVKDTENELHSYVWGEKLLQKLNYDFLEKLLIFVQGDIVKVLEVARLYTEAGREQLTFDRGFGFQHRKAEPKGTSLSKHITFSLAKPPSNDTFSSPTPEPRSTPKPVFMTSTSRTTLSTVPKYTAHGLDLHGLTVNDALSVTKKEVAKWWKTEMDERTAAGILSRYGQKANHVEPLRIVTGRGIHSVDGQARIRASVIRLLERDGYMIEEETGLVRVLGRKK